MTSPVSIVSLQGKVLDLFLDIVGRPAVDALGDGEAAAIAVAVTRGLDLVIDDRKARRILRQHLLRAQHVLAALGRRRAGDCFTKAQRFGCMHVPRTGTSRGHAPSQCGRMGPVSAAPIPLAQCCKAGAADGVEDRLGIDAVGAVEIGGCRPIGQRATDTCPRGRPARAHRWNRCGRRRHVRA
jgi:hypothetical protein